MGKHEDFLVRAAGVIDRVHRSASEVTEALGLPPEARATVVSALYSDVSPEEANKATVHRYLATLNRGQLDEILALLDATFAPNFSDSSHLLGELPSMGELPSLEAFRRVLSVLYTAFPDLRFTVTRMIAEGDWVAYSFTMRGRHTGEFVGHAPSGRAFTATGTTMYRLADGKIVERSGHFAEMHLWRELGVDIGRLTGAELIGAWLP